VSRLEVPANVAARAWDIREGRVPPAQPRDAATVILLRPAAPLAPSSSRPAPPGTEIYMLRRKRSMAFAPGAYVFPGGCVDESDADEGPPGSGAAGWAGPDPARLGRALGVPPARARALVRAAVRETFEESGVLLAGPSRTTVVSCNQGEDWEADRRALAERSLSLAGLLARRGLVLRADLLRPWARWVTPEAEELRYDTRFFVAPLPAGQRAAGPCGEADEVAWVRPAAAITAAEAGEIRLLPPTAATLRELAAFPDVPAILAARRRITPRQPRVILGDWLPGAPGAPGAAGAGGCGGPKVREGPGVRAWLAMPEDLGDPENPGSPQGLQCQE
jgi:8-oxo-dGTP pyrophosphatase MutT (NUDIX family)